MKSSLRQIATWFSGGMLSLAIAGCSVGFLGDDGTATGSGTATGVSQQSTSGTPTQVKITGPSTIAPNTCVTYFVGIADAYGNYTAATTTTTVTMTTTGGAFYSDANCTVASSTVTIPTGQVGNPIYYKDPTVQTVTLTGAATGLTSGTLPVTISGTGGTGGTGVPSRLTIIGANQTPINTCTPYYVSVLDASGLPAPVTTATVVTLSGQSSGAFYSDASCTAATSIATVPAGQNLGTFYFKDPIAQVVTLNAASGALTPGTLAVSVGGAGGGGSGNGGATGISLIVGNTVYINTCTMLTVQTVNSAGQVTPVATNAIIQLTGTGVQFYSDSGCTASLAPSNQVTIYAGQSQTIVWIRGTAAGTATITAQSVPAGILATVYINFYINGGGGTGTTNVPVIYDLLLSSNGQHIVGGVANGPSGYTCSAQAVEDCGGGNCSGQQSLCGIAGQNTSSAVLDVWLTPNGTHTQSIWCPNGYNLIGVINDCYGGSCSGYQSFCKATTNYPHATMALQGLSVSALNLHANQVSCPSGWDLVGTITDCGNRYCSGVQTMCSRKAYVP